MRVQLARPRDGGTATRARSSRRCARARRGRSPDLEAGDEFLACAADAACEAAVRAARSTRAAWREAVAPFFVMVDDGDARRRPSVISAVTARTSTACGPRSLRASSRRRPASSATTTRSRRRRRRRSSTTRAAARARARGHRRDGTASSCARLQARPKRVVRALHLEHADRNKTQSALRMAPLAPPRPRRTPRARPYARLSSASSHSRPKRAAPPRPCRRPSGGRPVGGRGGGRRARPIDAPPSSAWSPRPAPAAPATPSFAPAPAGPDGLGAAGSAV